MTKLICESCNHGYPDESDRCPWCGANPFISHSQNVASRVDTECFIDYWLCAFSTGEEFEMYPGQPLDIEGLRRTLSLYTIVTFNGQHYDMPMIALALSGYSTIQLKAASDAIIVENLKSWQLLERYGVRALDWVDHIDLFDVAPGQASLKAYGGKMHSRKLQDLPLSPSASIGPGERFMLREYCRNDLDITSDLHATFPTQLKLREEMSAEYGVDVRSKSDAQIAEAVMKSLLGFKVERPYIAPGTQFYYRAPEWLQSPHLELINRSPFTITQSGGVAMTEELERTVIRIGNTAYKLGIGGLHSMESVIKHVADEHTSLTDHDVASYYPTLILRTGIFPTQIGPIFTEIYRGWYDRRLAAKRAGDKKNANSLKTLLNGTFGKLGSRYSIFYAPSEMIQVTVTGQLALLMLIQALESSGISVVSANTDGIVVKCPKVMEFVRDDVIRWWERVTQFETEFTRYQALYSRDVNSYIALKEDGEPKLKGEYAPPEPGASGWPSPTGQVCVDAVVAYLRYGVMLEDTIRECTDIKRFIYTRQVTGGGAYHANGTLPKTTTQTEMRIVLQAHGIDPTGMDKANLTGTYEALRLRRLIDGQYLGKVVRWYYAKGSKGCISYSGSGNLVATTDGCKPLMTLPDTLPTDIDYDWYAREARVLLADIGVTPPA